MTSIAKLYVVSAGTLYNPVPDLQEPRAGSVPPALRKQPVIPGSRRLKGGSLQPGADERSLPGPSRHSGLRPVKRGFGASVRTACSEPPAGQLTVSTAVLLVRSGSKSKGYSPNSPKVGWMLTAPVAPGSTVSTRTENANVRWVSSSTQYRRSQS